MAEGWRPRRGRAEHGGLLRTVGLRGCAGSSHRPGSVPGEWVGGAECVAHVGPMGGGVGWATLEARPLSWVLGRARQPRATDAGWDTRGQALTWCMAPPCPPQTPLSPASPLQLLMCQPQCQPRGTAQPQGTAQLRIMARPCPCPAIKWLRLRDACPRHLQHPHPPAQGLPPVPATGTGPHGAPSCTLIPRHLHVPRLLPVPRVGGGVSECEA